LPPQELSAQDRAQTSRAPVVFGSRFRGWILLAGVLLPAVLAVWTTPSFVTQDGPAHLYNTHILARSLAPDSPFRDVFRVNWSPLPNWSGHLLGMLLVSILPPGSADRAATTIPLLGLAASTFWLRRRVAGSRGEAWAAVVSALLALNVAWLFGFTSFLIGACLFPITLGVWWGGRDGLGWARTLAIAVLIVLGYLAHVVSLGLTVVALGWLAILTPGPHRRIRLVRTALGVSPILVLGPIYRRLMGTAGPISPVWGQWTNLRSLSSWREQFGWVDPISLGKKGVFPGLIGESAWLGIVSPIALLLAAILLLGATTRLGDRDRLGWLTLGMVFLLGGFVCPDTLGPSHGNYLPQRVVLLGFVALVPWLHFDASRWPGKLGVALLGLALLVQTLTVWDYAYECSERVGPFVRSLPHVGRGQRIGTLLINIRGRFRANPVLHADNLLGVGTGNIVWYDYETIHYYFPVQFQDRLRRPPAEQFQEVAFMDDPKDAGTRAAMWQTLLDGHHDEIDLLLVWGRDPTLDAINARWFRTEPTREDGALRILEHR
jgi:hypothetical protein